MEPSVDPALRKMFEGARSDVKMNYDKGRQTDKQVIKLGDGKNLSVKLYDKETWEKLDLLDQWGARLRGNISKVMINNQEFVVVKPSIKDDFYIKGNEKLKGKKLEDFKKEEAKALTDGTVVQVLKHVLGYDMDINTVEDQKKQNRVDAKKIPKLIKELQSEVIKNIPIKFRSTSPGGLRAEMRKAIQENVSGAGILKNYRRPVQNKGLDEVCKQKVLDWITPYVSQYSDAEFESLKKEFGFADDDVRIGNLGDLGKSEKSAIATEEVVSRFKKSDVCKKLFEEVSDLGGPGNQRALFGFVTGNAEMELQRLHIPKTVRDKILLEAKEEALYLHCKNEKISDLKGISEVCSAFPGQFSSEVQLKVLNRLKEALGGQPIDVGQKLQEMNKERYDRLKSASIEVMKMFRGFEELNSEKEIKNAIRSLNAWLSDKRELKEFAFTPDEIERVANDAVREMALKLKSEKSEATSGKSEEYLTIEKQCIEYVDLIRLPGDEGYEQSTLTPKSLQEELSSAVDKMCTGRNIQLTSIEKSSLIADLTKHVQEKRGLK